MSQRQFNSGPPKGGDPIPNFGGLNKQGGENDDGGYTTDEDGKTFENERRFSNFIMFLGSFSMVVIFAISNVIQLKKQKE